MRCKAIAKFRNNPIGRFQFWLLKKLLNTNVLILRPRGRGSNEMREKNPNHSWCNNDIGWREGEWFAVYIVRNKGERVY